LDGFFGIRLGEVGLVDVDWIGLAKDRNRWRALVNWVLNLRVPLNAGKLSGGLTSSVLSSSAQLHAVSASGCTESDLLRSEKIWRQ
jgi:hypothetical protein